MKILSLLFVLGAVALPVHAEVFKCKVGAKTVYQDYPCRSGAVVDLTYAVPPSSEDQYRAIVQGRKDVEIAQQMRERDEQEHRHRAAIEIAQQRAATTRHVQVDDGCEKRRPEMLRLDREVTRRRDRQFREEALKVFEKYRLECGW